MVGNSFIFICIGLVILMWLMVKFTGIDQYINTEDDDILEHFNHERRPYLDLHENEYTEVKSETVETTEQTEDAETESEINEEIDESASSSDDTEEFEQYVSDVIAEVDDIEEVETETESTVEDDVISDNTGELASEEVTEETTNNIEEVAVITPVDNIILLYDNEIDEIIFDDEDGPTEEEMFLLLYKTIEPIESFTHLTNKENNSINDNINLNFKARTENFSSIENNVLLSLKPKK